MPFDDFINLSDDLTSSDLDKIDRQAVRAEKALDRVQKKLRRKGAIFAKGQEGDILPSAKAKRETPNVSSSAPVSFAPGLSKEDKKIEKKFDRLQEKVRKDIVKQLSKKDGGIIQNAFGNVGADNIFSIAKNPTGFITGLAQGLPFLGGVFALKQVADFVIKEIQKLDSFFKQFVDRVDTRQNQFRDIRQQAEIAAGIRQRITTTVAGSVDARDAYNTYQIFNENQSELESDFTIRNTSGVD